jgi:hypothetical protein
MAIMTYWVGKVQMPFLKGDGLEKVLKGDAGSLGDWEVWPKVLDIGSA